MRFKTTARSNRDAILEFVRSQPGIHSAEIAYRLSLSWSTVAYHVRVLRKQGLLQADRTQREVQLFPTELPAEQRVMLAVLRESNTQLVLQRIASTPHGVPEISAGVGLSQKEVRRHLHKLTDSGLALRGDQPKPLYVASEDAGTALRDVLRRSGTHGLDV